MIENFLGKRYSTKNLSDEEFDLILPILAKELSQVNYHYNYTESELKKDWENLCKFETNLNYINSTSRIGMRLCEHFFPNFFDIKNKNGVSFDSLWNDIEFLKKVLRWNRKSHSTPYLSELRRGIYFCGGMVKSTMYRPQLSKIITKDSKVILDPCAGWGGRMLGVVANNSSYYGFEPNKKTYENLLMLVDFLGIANKVTLYCDDARNMNNYDIPIVDCVLTSPPYYDIEVYCDEETQSIHKVATYNQWAQEFLHPIIKMSINKLDSNGISCWNVAKIKSGDMWNDVNKIHELYNFKYLGEYKVISSKRQTNGSGKSQDLTICYSRI